MEDVQHYSKESIRFFVFQAREPRSVRASTQQPFSPTFADLAQQNSKLNSS
jgi:hypothetical protein